jgi:hypothetical protein
MIHAIILHRLAHTMTTVGMALRWDWLFAKGGNLEEYSDRLYWSHR